MQETDLTKVTKEELLKREKTAKVVSYLFIGVIIIQLATGIFLTIKQGFSIFMIVPIAFVPILMITISNLKKIRTEIDSRTK
jgi:hypothetical protein